MTTEVLQIPSERTGVDALTEVQGGCFELTWSQQPRESFVAKLVEINEFCGILSLRFKFEKNKHTAQGSFITANNYKIQRSAENLIIYSDDRILLELKPINSQENRSFVVPQEPEARRNKEGASSFTSHHPVLIQQAVQIMDDFLGPEAIFGEVYEDVRRKTLKLLEARYSSLPTNTSDLIQLSQEIEELFQPFWKLLNQFLCDSEAKIAEMFIYNNSRPYFSKWMGVNKVSGHEENNNASKSRIPKRGKLSSIMKLTGIEVLRDMKVITTNIKWTRILIQKLIAKYQSTNWQGFDAKNPAESVTTILDTYLNLSEDKKLQPEEREILVQRLANMTRREAIYFCGLTRAFQQADSPYASLPEALVAAYGRRYKFTQADLAARKIKPESKFLYSWPEENITIFNVRAIYIRGLHLPKKPPIKHTTEWWELAWKIADTDWDQAREWGISNRKDFTPIELAIKAFPEYDLKPYMFVNLGKFIKRVQYHSPNIVLGGEKELIEAYLSAKNRNSERKAQESLLTYIRSVNTRSPSPMVRSLLSSEDQEHEALEMFFWILKEIGEHSFTVSLAALWQGANHYVVERALKKDVKNKKLFPFTYKNGDSVQIEDQTTFGISPEQRYLKLEALREEGDRDGELELLLTH